MYIFITREVFAEPLLTVVALRSMKQQSNISFNVEVFIFGGAPYVPTTTSIHRRSLTYGKRFFEEIYIQKLYSEQYFFFFFFFYLFLFLLPEKQHDTRCTIDLKRYSKRYKR